MIASPDPDLPGGNHMCVSTEFIRALTENLPDNELIISFDEKVAPIYKLKYQLHFQNQRLKEARDILLPRPMTGMIDVESLHPEPLVSEVAVHAV